MWHVQISVSCRGPREAGGNWLLWRTWQRRLPRGAAQYLQVSSNHTVNILTAPGVFSYFARAFLLLPHTTTHLPLPYVSCSVLFKVCKPSTAFSSAINAKRSAECQSTGYIKDTDSHTTYSHEHEIPPH